MNMYTTTTEISNFNIPIGVKTTLPALSELLTGSKTSNKWVDLYRVGHKTPTK